MRRLPPRGPSRMNKLSKVVTLKGLRFPDDIQADLVRFANKANRTLAQQVRHYVIESVVAEREGVSSLAVLTDILKRYKEEQEEIKAQLAALVQEVRGEPSKRPAADRPARQK